MIIDVSRSINLNFDYLISILIKPNLSHINWFNVSYILHFFILNFRAAFKSKGLHIKRNEVFGTWNPFVLQICFKYMFNSSTKSQPVHIIMVEQFIKKPVLFLSLEGVTVHWFVVGCMFNIINIWHKLAASLMKKILLGVTQSNDKRSTKNSWVSFS